MKELQDKIASQEKEIESLKSKLSLANEEYVR